MLPAYLQHKLTVFRLLAHQPDRFTVRAADLRAIHRGDDISDLKPGGECDSYAIGDGIVGTHTQAKRHTRAPAHLHPHSVSGHLQFFRGFYNCSAHTAQELY